MSLRKKDKVLKKMSMQLGKKLVKLQLIFHAKKASPKIMLRRRLNNYFAKVELYVRFHQN